MAASSGPGRVTDRPDPDQAAPTVNPFGSALVTYDGGFSGQLSDYSHAAKGAALAAMPAPRSAPGVVVAGGPAVALHRGAFTSDINAGSGRTVYDDGYPVKPVSGLFATHADTDILSGSQQDTPHVDVNIRRYIDTAVGGRTGVVTVAGYSTGFRRWWNGGIGTTNAFTGRTKRFVTRDLAKDTGPVGRSNYAGQLQSAVASQYHIPPTLEDIYRSLTGMASIEGDDNG